MTERLNPIRPRGLDFGLAIAGLPPFLDLNVTEFHFDEALSQLFTLDLTLVSSRPDLDLSEFLLKRCTFSVYSNGKLLRKIDGLISSGKLGKIGVRKTFYSLGVRPSLWLLTQRQNSRIFHEKSIPEILEQLMQEHHVSFDKKLIDDHLIREYVTQKRETDFDFFLRLASEEGITFWFECKDEEICYFSDSNQGLTGGTKLEYNPHPQRIETGNFASLVDLSVAMTPQKVIGKDRDYENPNYDFEHEYAEKTVNVDADKCSVFESYAKFPKDSVAKKLTQYRLEAIQVQSEIGKAESNAIQIRPGNIFQLTNHPNPKLNQAWQPIKVIHSGFLPQAMEEDADGSTAALSNTIDFISADKNFRAPYRHKPLAEGSEVATVVGPAGEEIFTNEYGAVKVHFHWNRYDKADEKASCWVRVIQGWSGEGYGFYAIPRIGQEVIVTYLNGDIDQPIVSGSTFNGNMNRPIYLPEHKTQTVFRTKTHKGSGFNEIRFEDKTNEENLFLHSHSGETDLNLGHLQREGNRAYRGNGFELRTDDWGAIRAGKGLYISTDKREKAEGKQLDIQEAIEQLEHSLILAKEIAKAAKTAQAESADVEDQESRLKETFTDLAQAGVLLSSPEGVALTSPKSVHLNSKDNIILTTEKSVDVSTHHDIRMAAKDIISMVSIEDDMKLITNQGEMKLQAQHNNLEMVANKTLKILSTEDQIVLAAEKEILLTSGGAYIKIKDGMIELGGSFPLIVKMENINLVGSETLSYAMPTFSESSLCIECLKRAAQKGAPMMGIN